MRIKKGFVIEKVADSYLACATGALAKEFSGFVRLNSTGAFLWKMIDDGAESAEELCVALVKEYEISEQTARADIDLFLKKLRDNGILEE